MRVEPDSPGGLGNACALLESVAHPLHAVLLHRSEEAAAELRPRRAGVKERGGRVDVPALAHQPVRLARGGDVRAVDADGDTHEHVLRPLGDGAAAAEEVRPLEGLECEEVEVEVTAVSDLGVEARRVGRDDGVNVIGDQAGRLPCRGGQAVCSRAYFQACCSELSVTAEPFWVIYTGWLIDHVLAASVTFGCHMRARPAMARTFRSSCTEHTLRQAQSQYCNGLHASFCMADARLGLA